MLRLLVPAWARGSSHRTALALLDRRMIYRAALGLLWAFSTQPLVVRAEPLMIGAPAAGINETGVPDYVFVSTQSLGLASAPTDLKKLPDGRLLAVGYGELALGDGFRWEVFQQEESEAYPRQRLQNVAVDNDGAIYAGVNGDLCRIEFTAKGKWRLAPAVSMTPILGEKSPSMIFTAQVQDHWFWWWGSGPVVSWRPGEKATVVVDHTNAPQSFFSSGGRVHYSDFSNGKLYELRDGEFKPVPDTNPGYVERTITSSEALDEHRSLVGTLGLGVQVMDASRTTPLTIDGPLSTGNRINDLKKVGEGLYAAAVETSGASVGNSGILFFNSQGRVLQSLTLSTDHHLSRVRKLVPLGGGIIWAVAKDGLIAVRFPGQISHFESLIPTGLDYTQPYRIDGKLWLMSNGVALVGDYDATGKLSGFRPDSPEGYMSALQEIQNRVVVATQLGIFSKGAGGKWELIPGAAEIHGANFSEVPFEGKHWLFSAEGKVGWVHADGDSLSAEAFPLDAIGHTYRAATDGEGSLWAELGSGRVAKVTPHLPWPTVRVFDKRDGLPEIWIRLSIVDGKAHLILTDRVLSWDSVKNTWVENSMFLESLKRSGFRQEKLVVPNGRPSRDAFGRLWTVQSGGIHVLDSRGAQPDLTGAPTSAENFTPQTDGVVWIHQRGALARFDPAMPRVEGAANRTLITRLFVPAKDRTLFVNGKEPLVLEPDETTVVAHFLAQEAQIHLQTTFRFSLDDSAWDAADTQGLAVFNQLRSGDHVLRVRSHVGTEEGPPAELHFTVKPPFYRTPLAYVLYAVFGTVVVVVAIIGPVKIQRGRKKLLEKEVRERTVALEASERRYRDLNHELEQRVEQRTEELRLRIKDVEELNKNLDRSAAELSEANIRLTATNKELESFSYSVSHDLRSPLRSIDGFSRAIEEDYAALLDDAGREYLARIRSGAQKMGTLIDDLLKLARISRVEMKREVVDLSAIVATIYNHLHNTDPDRIVDFYYDPKMRSQGDAQLIQIALENLIENAWKYTRRKTVSRIEFGQVSEVGHPAYGMLFIKDNGAGFDMRYADKLFTAFNRLHGPSEFEGTGIGLATVNRIIARHGGQIFAEAEVGRGATFFFIFQPQRPSPSAGPTK